MNKKQTSALLTRFAKLQHDLYTQLSSDPRGAVARVDALGPKQGIPEVWIRSLQGSIRIDAGFDLRDKTIVAEGVALLEELSAIAPTSLDLSYNLGNGLTALAELDPYEGPEWYLRTAELRRRAKSLFQFASEMPENSDQQARAQANLGNALLKAYRFPEAYECYRRSLAFDPTNTIAATGAARILIDMAHQGIGEANVLLAVANEHLTYVREHPEALERLAGREAFESLRWLLEAQLPNLNKPDYTRASKYEQFVMRNRLALSPTIEGLDLSLARWDSLGLASVFVPRTKPYGIPEVFGTFNVLKADLLAARHLAFTAVEKPPPESGKYADTLDYATYGVGPASIVLAQRAALDVLDKIAIATHLYLGDDDPGRYASFHNSFVDRDKNGVPIRWTKLIENEMQLRNWGVIALAELSVDVAQKGFLQSKKDLRNAATHRFVILHDVWTPKPPGASVVVHYDASDFTRQVIETLQVAKAALIYFVEAVRLREARVPPDTAFPMDVPDHDVIRGRRPRRRGNVKKSPK